MADRLRGDERERRMSATTRTGSRVESSWEADAKAKKKPDPKKARKRGRAIKIVGALVVVFIAAVGALLVFLPTLASGPVRGAMESALNDRINGTAQVERVKLSWSGVQRVGPVVLNDPAGEEVARVEAQTDSGLLAMLGMSLGTITVNGDARIERGADGVTNLERVLAPMLKADPRGSGGGGGGGGAGAGAGGEPSLPSGLNATLVIDTISVRFIDEQLAARSGGRVGAVAVDDLRGRASVAVGAPITLNLEAQARTAMSEAGLRSSASDAGTLSVNVTADGFTASSGALTLDQGRVNAKVSAEGLSVAAADAVAAMGGRLVEALGPTASLRIEADGPVSAMTASFNAEAESVSAQGALAYDGKILRQTDPIRVRAETQRLAALAPEVRSALLGEGEAGEAGEGGGGGGGATLEGLPVVTLEVTALQLPLVADASKLSPETMDLRGGALDAIVRAEGVRGSAMVGGEGGARRAFATEPIELRLSAPNFAETWRLTGGTSATVDGASAGQVRVDASAGGLLTDTGGLRAGGPRSIEGSLTVDQLASAVLQPFAAGAGLDLTQTLGETLSASVTASTVEGAETTDGGVPDADATLELTSSNVTAQGALRVRAGVLTTDEPGLTLRAQALAPTLNALMGDSGARVTRAGGAKARITGVRADLNRIGAGDLRGTAAQAEVNIDALAGTAPGAEGGAGGDFALAPTSIRVSTDALERGLRLTAGRAEGDAPGRGGPEGAGAGTITADLTAEGLLTEGGALRGVPGAVRGTATLNRVSTAVAQPFVSAMGLDLVRDVGPTMTLALSADARQTPGGGQDAGATLPETDLSLSLMAQHLELKAEGRVEPGLVRLTGEGLTLRAQRAGAMAAALVGREGPVALDGAGGVTARVTQLRAPLNDDQQIDLERVTFDVAAEMGGMAALVMPVGEPEPGAPPMTRERIAVERVALKASRAEGGPAKATLDGRMQYGERAFTLSGDMTAPGLMETIARGAFEADPSSMPVGALELKDVPTRLVRLAGLNLTGAGGASIDESALAANVIGETVGLKVTGARADGGAYGVRAEVTSALAKGGVGVRLTREVVEVEASEIVATVDPRTADLLIQTFAPDVQQAVAQPVRLARPLTARLKIGASRVPVTESFAVDASRVKDDDQFRLTLSVDGATTPIVLKNAEGGAGLNLGPATLRNVRVDVGGGLGALVEAGKARTVQALLGGQVLGEGGRTLASLDGRVRQLYRAGAPAGPLDGSVTLGELSTDFADVIAGQPGLVSGAMGPTAAIEVLLSTAAASDGGAAGERGLRANVTSERFNTTRPLVVDMSGDRITLPTPMVAEWTMTPAWADRFLFGAVPGEPVNPDQPRLHEPTTWQLNLRRLTLAQGEGVGPLKPGVFDLQVILTAPTFRVTGAGETLAIEGVTANLWRSDEPGRLEVRAEAERVGGSPARKDAPLLRASVTNVADASGALTTDKAQVSGKATLQAFPTPVLDAVAKQNGLLTDLLGPTISLEAQADKLSATGGYVSVDTFSERATANMRGNIRDGVLLTVRDSTEVRVNRITPELSERFVQGMPVAAKFEKTREDAPGVIRVTQIALPLEGDVSKLNGVVVIDPGVVRFQTESAFQSLLKLAKQRDAGVVGQRLQPLTVSIVNGVVSYGKTKAEGRYRLPVGEFSVELEGTVDLPQERLDVIVWIPAGSVADEVLGVFGTGIPAALGRAAPGLDSATMLPFRVKGPMSNPGRPQPAPDLFVSNLGENLIGKPVENLGEGLKNLLEGGDPLKGLRPGQQPARDAPKNPG